MTKASRIAAALLLAAVIGSSFASSAQGAAFGSRPLSVGSKGKDVRALQRHLTLLGYTTATTGVFTKETKTAVKRLERKQGWKVDGRVNRKDALRIGKLVAKKNAKKPQTLFLLGSPTQPTATVEVKRPGSLQLNVIDANNGLGVFSFPVTFNAPGTQTIGWNGWTAANIWAPDSAYKFQLASVGETGASLSGQVKPFLFRHFTFPVPGQHTYSLGAGRFGNDRGDHIHQGQDIGAPCGEKLYAVEAGTITTNAYQVSGAGNYIVIKGAYSGGSHVYMHMQKPSWAEEGTKVYPGQQLGKVGNTGRSSGCHLHFERWTAPGWYQGGSAYDPLPELRYWDAYS